MLDRHTKFLWDALEPRLLLAAFPSDDFNATALDARWTFVDPVGGGSVVTDGTNAMLSVPGGVDHDVWTAGNRSVRLMQPAVDEDFELEVKFESTPTAKYQLQGVIVESAPGTYLRMDYYHDGAGLRVFAASFAGNSPTVRYNQPAAVGWQETSTLYMRVRQQGDQWTQRYSYDGSAWTAAASFTRALEVSQVGVFAGNAAGSSSPAFAASVDYFFNNAGRIDPEDADATLDATPPLLSRIRYSTSGTSTEVTWLTNELSTGLVQYGLTSTYELGSVTQSQLATAHSVVLENLQPGMTYHFRVVATNQNGLTAHSQDWLFVAGDLAEQAPTLSVWYGDHQSFGQLGNAQRWVNVLGRVADPDGIASLKYSLNGGASRDLAWGPTTLRLEAAGDFNVEIDRAELVPGTNVVNIVATDALGETTSRAVEVTYTAGVVGPAEYVADWSAASTIGDVAQVVDGLWALEENGVRTVETGYDRTIAIGDVSWQDYEVTVPITIHGTNPNGSYGPPGVGIIMRWAGHYDGWGGQPRTKWWPLGALGWYRGGRLEIIGNDMNVIARESDGRTLATGTTYLFKMRVESSPDGGTSKYSLKVWPQGTSEPSAWDLTGTGIAGELTRGSVLLTSHHTDATFGTVSVVPVVDQPPTIQSVQSQPGATFAEVSWSTDEPATGVVEYGLTDQYELGAVSQTAPATSHSVVLQELEPGTTYHFRIVATDAGSNATSSQNYTFTTTAPDTTPPAILSVSPQPSSTQAQITWGTDELATGVVQYGLTADYELGSVPQGQLATSHAVLLEGLQPEATYHFRITATDGSGNATTSGDFQFTTSAGAFRSDDFSGGLDASLWTFVDPVGDGSVATDGTRALISVPGGTDHDAWKSGNRSARLMQAASDEDFELEVKFESTPSARYQLQGLLVEAAPGTYLRFDFYHDGSALRVFAASFAANSPTTRYSKPAAAGWGSAAALYMRVKRRGGQWTQSYSYDRTSWHTAASFSHALAVAQVGVFAGNASGSTSPAYTAAVDYFFNTASPIDPEDAVIMTSTLEEEDETEESLEVTA